MLTNPSTLGLFDEGIEEVAAIFHERGALLYYDGANLNAVVGLSRPGRHGLRHRPLQPPQDLLAAARRRRARAVGRSPFARSSSRSSRRRRSCATGDTLPARSRPSEVDRPRARVLRPVRRVRPLVRVHARVRAGAQGHVRGRGAERQLRARAAQGRLRPAVRPALHARVRALRPHAEARARRHRARRREAAHGLRHPPADDLLPARRLGGADDRADRDRDEGAARRVRRRDALDRVRGGDRARDAEGRAARRGPCGVSTR